MKDRVQAGERGAKPAGGGGLYHPRYNTERFSDKTAEAVMAGPYPVKMRQSAAARTFLVFVMIAIVVPPLAPGRIVLASGTNQLDGALERLERHLSAAST